MSLNLVSEISQNKNQMFLVEKGFKWVDILRAWQFSAVLLLLLKWFEDMIKLSGVSYMRSVSQCRRLYFS